jgi:hypothetical protein
MRAGRGSLCFRESLLNIFHGNENFARKFSFKGKFFAKRFHENLKIFVFWL